MFDDVQKLFGKTFAIGYFIPSLLYLGLASLLLVRSNRFPSSLAEVANVVDATLLAALYVVAASLLGVLLMALNRTVFRFVEGYAMDNVVAGITIPNPLSLIRVIEVRRFERLVRMRERLEDRLSAGGSPQDQARLDRVIRELETSLPHRASLVLPTRFGNTLRAYEVYSSEMYGFDLVKGWYRLATVIPEPIKEELDQAKAQVDFWLNMALLTVALGVYPLTVTGFQVGTLDVGNWSMWGQFALIVAMSLVFTGRATSAAQVRGEHYKSAVDIYLPALAKKLAEHEGIDVKNNRAFWSAFSQAIVYRAPDKLPPK